MLPFGFVESGNYEKDKYTKDDDGNIWFEQEWTGNAKF